MPESSIPLPLQQFDNFVNTSAVRSPLTGGRKVRETRSLPVADIIAQWRANFGIDVTDELAAIEAVREYLCEETGLFFFEPQRAVGSPRLYERLSTFSWYYNPDKWEHRHALVTLPPAARLLEVGCGNGDFISKAEGAGWGRAEGVEINEAAAQFARDAGREVYTADLSAFALAHAEEYDLVCAFQVLEHVSQPRVFLEDCVRLVRPGGHMIVAVPNADALLGRQPNLLDAPPHHMTRWGKRSLGSAGRLLGLDLVSVTDEPLADYHVNWYVGSTQIGGGRLRRALWARAGRPALRRALASSTRLRSLLSGHTHAACYRKP